MRTAIIHARIEPATKQKAERVIRKLGMTPTEAIRIFYRQIILRDGLPFRVAVPNSLTAATLQKSRQGQELEQFGSTEQMFESWEK
jgi:DNA-damage-inducible protein J